MAQLHSMSGRNTTCIQFHSVCQSPAPLVQLCVYFFSSCTSSLYDCVPHTYYSHLCLITSCIFSFCAPSFLCQFILSNFPQHFVSLLISCTRPFVFPLVVFACILNNKPSLALLKNKYCGLHSLFHLWDKLSTHSKPKANLINAPVETCQKTPAWQKRKSLVECIPLNKFHNTFE